MEAFRIYGQDLAILAILMEMTEVQQRIARAVGHRHQLRHQLQLREKQHLVQP